MNPLFVMPIMVAAAAAVAGWTCETLAAAAVGSALAMWALRPAGRADGGFVNLDRARPDLSALREALRLAVERARETQTPFALRISAPAPTPSPQVRLDLDAQGDLLVLRAGAPLPLERPGLWIPDHPLPLVLPRLRCTTLRCIPCGNRRVRVALDSGRTCGTLVWAALACLAAIACTLDAAALLAAVVGFAGAAYLHECQERRAQ